MALKLAETREHLSAEQIMKDSGAEKLREEISVKMMADLQERQSLENNALMQAMIQSVSLRSDT